MMCHVTCMQDSNPVLVRSLSELALRHQTSGDRDGEEVEEQDACMKGELEKSAIPEHA